VLRILSIARWSEMQHYKHRNPPWIKLHAELLDRPEFRALSSCDVGTYCKLLLIAARNGNRIAFDARWLRRRYGVSSIAVRNLEQAGLIAIAEPDDDDGRSALDRQPNGDRSATDPSPIGVRSVTDPSPIGAHSHTDRLTIESAHDTQQQSDQASTSSSASAALAHRLRDADSEGEGETEREGEGEGESERRNSLRRAAKDALPPMKSPSPKGSRRNGDFEQINAAVERVIAQKACAQDDFANIARIADITETQARTSVRQLRDRGRIR
jgi:hypothetical protein